MHQSATVDSATTIEQSRICLMDSLWTPPPRASIPEMMCPSALERGRAAARPFYLRRRRRSAASRMSTPVNNPAPSTSRSVVGTGAESGGEGTAVVPDGTLVGEGEVRVSIDGLANAVVVGSTDAGGFDAAGDPDGVAGATPLLRVTMSFVPASTSRPARIDWAITSRSGAPLSA